MLSRDPLANPERLIRRVYAYVAYRIGNGPDAEDVTSATFERALRYRASYDRRQGEPLSWLIGIARRCIADAAVAHSQETVVELPEAVAPGDLEADTTQRLDTAAAVRLLSPRDRELVALRYGADLTARQIAELLGERPNTIEVALHRALARLRAILEGEAVAEPEEPTAGGRGKEQERTVSSPESSKEWRQLGQAQLSQGRIADARESFEQALELAPRDWELWLDLALASEGRARAHALAVASQLNPLSPEIAEFRRVQRSSQEGDA